MVTPEKKRQVRRLEGCLRICKKNEEYMGIVIENKCYDEERALYVSDGLTVMLRRSVGLLTVWMPPMGVLSVLSLMPVGWTVTL